MDLFGVVSGAYSPTDVNLLSKLPVNAAPTGTTNTYSLNTGTPAGTLGNGGTPISALIGTTTTIFASLTPLVYQVDYYALISNAPVNNGFSAVSFDAVYSPALTIPASRTPDYAPDLSKVTSTIGYWSVNEDAGPNHNDLQAIVATDQIAGGKPFPAGDPRATLAQGSAAYIGSLYLLWDGTAPATLGIGNLQYTTLDETTGLSGSATFATDPFQIVIQPAPEPTSLTVLTAAATLMFRRKRAHTSA
jgi:hypothetical protein